MHFNWIDWAIFAALFVAINAVAYFFRRYVRGVSHFLVAGRGVGRYLGLGSDSMQGIGAVSFLAFWQMFYVSGFVGLWWALLIPFTTMLVSLTGFGICRFRKTRAMTLGQFVEMRYGRKTRIFFGSLAYLSGIINMGIFPAISSRFFIYYCGLPPVLNVAGLEIPTFWLLMFILVGSSVLICFWGGQVTLIITDFIQSIFVDILLVVIMIFIYRMFTWDQFAEAFQSVEQSAELLQPVHGTSASQFNKWFFLMFIFNIFYGIIAWAPQTMQASSAKDAHEAKMMRVMVEFKKLILLGLGMGVLPLAVFVMMHHADFSTQANEITGIVNVIGNEQVRNQMLTPAALHYILPTGFLGAFAGVMLFALISTYDTYLLAWGGMLVQDVILPLRKGKPLEPKRHMMWIKFSVLFVGAFIIVFSMFFNQVDNIFMFFALSACIYSGSAGIVLLGGLYWKRGTIRAAWAAMIICAILGLSGLVYRQFNPDFLNGKIIEFWVSVVGIAIFITISFLKKNKKVQLEEVLSSEKKVENPITRFFKNLKNFKWSDEVPKSDRILIPCIIAGMTLFITLFVGSLIADKFFAIPIVSWLKFWHVFVYFMFFMGTAFLVWVITGGVRDLIRLLRKLKTEHVNIHDDGSVEDHHAAK